MLRKRQWRAAEEKRVLIAEQTRKVRVVRVGIGTILDAQLHVKSDTSYVAVMDDRTRCSSLLSSLSCPWFELPAASRSVLAL